MKLIEDSDWEMSVFLAREIDVDDEILNGKEIWQQYKDLLQDQTMDYARKQIELSDIRSKLNNFIYQISKASAICYDDRIGELYCIENGEDYFNDGVFDREKLECRGTLFVD